MTLKAPICRWTLCLLLWLVLSGSALAENETQIRLLLSARTARPGDTVWAGLELDMPAPWHTYWRFAGDAGEPTTIKWTLPEGVTAGEIQWPLPLKEVDTAIDPPLVTYVYTNQVVLPVALTLSKSLKPGPLTISGAVKWMECAEICKFGNGDVNAQLTIGDQPDPSSDAAIIESWRKKVPLPATESKAEAFWDSKSTQQKGTRQLDILLKAPVDFYPFNTNFQMLSPTEFVASKDGIIVVKKIQKGEGDWPKQIDGILVVNFDSSNRLGVEEHLSINNAESAPAEITKPAATEVIAKPPAAEKISEESLLLELLGAFVGGLILNIMPCVLPVIALKILSFVNQSKEEPRRVKQLGAVYGLGVLACFLVLGLLAVGVQRAGGVANWGDAIRNPQFQIAITILMTLVALNLFGVFEIAVGGKVMGAASELSGKSGFLGAFFNGALATILATPCTAPFLGAALGFALTQSAAVILLFFLVAGLGLALPFVILCLNPGLLKLLPKPGVWMEKFKNFMGFPMLATVVWLIWVSSSKEDDELWLGLFLVVVSLVAWIWGEFVQRGTKGRTAAVVICLLLLGSDYAVILEKELHWRASGETTPAAGEIDWKVWSPEAVETARRAGHPVFVDFTAKSCLTCHVNLATSIDIAPTRAKLKQIGAVTFKADFTHEDPAIANELRRFNTSGVPLVLVYSKDVNQPPQVLPTTLTPSIVLAALDKANGS